MGNKKSKLLEKVGLGTGIVGFAAGLGFAINSLLIDKPGNYLALEEVKSKIWFLEKAKGNLQKAENYFCSQNFDNELKNLYSEKSRFENTSECKLYEKNVAKNQIYAGFSSMIMASGAFLFLLKYSKRRALEDLSKELNK